MSLGAIGGTLGAVGGTLIGAEDEAPLEVYVSDTFDRADGSMGSAETGQAWASAAGTWAIASNKAYLSTATTNGRLHVQPSQADVEVSCDITLSPTANSTHAGVIARGGASHRGIVAIIVKISGATTGQVNLVVGTTTVSTWVSAGLVDGQTYTLKLKVSGRYVVAYLDGVVAGTHYLSDAQVSDIGSQTNVGLWCDRRAGNDDGGSRFDNFQATAVNAVQPRSVGYSGPVQAFPVDTTPLVELADISGATGFGEYDAIVHDPDDPNLATNPEREWKFYFSALVSGAWRVYVAFSADGSTFGDYERCTLGVGDREAQDPSVLQSLATPGLVHRVGGKLVMYVEDFAVSSDIRGYESTDGITFTDLGVVLDTVTGSPCARFDGTNYIVGYELRVSGDEGFGIAWGASTSSLTKSVNNPIWMPADDPHANASIVLDDISAEGGKLCVLYHDGLSPKAGVYNGRGLSSVTDPTALVGGDIATVGTNLSADTADVTRDHSVDGGLVLGGGATILRKRLAG